MRSSRLCSLTEAASSLFIALIFIGAGALKAVLYFQEIWAGHVSQVDGDNWTELQRDSESADR